MYPKNFVGICHILGLNWREIAGLEMKSERMFFPPPELNLSYISSTREVTTVHEALGALVETLCEMLRRLTRYLATLEPDDPNLAEFTWNHTTLWALRADPTITYLQAGFGTDYKAKMEKLWAKFPGEILMHIEWTAGNSKMNQEIHRPLTGENVLVGGIPLVRYKSDERLQEILDYCEEIDVFIANPHTYFLEEGGLHPDIAEKRAFKDKMDPHSLLNPGKMKTYPKNPFAQTT